MVVLNGDQGAVAAALDELEADLARANLTALVDDRPDSAGIKFKDADLIGIPVRFTLGPRRWKRAGLKCGTAGPARRVWWRSPRQHRRLAEPAED